MRMYRGTTPTLKVKVKGIDLSELESIYFTIRQGKTEITKEKDELSIGEDNVFSVYLTQEDTLMLRMGYVYVQMRATTKDGLAIASNAKMVFVKEILKEGVIF